MIKMPQEIRQDGVSPKFNDLVFYGSGGKRKFLMIVSSYAFLLTIIFCVVLLIDSETRQTDPLDVCSWSRWWRASTSKHGPDHPKDWRNLLVSESSNYTSTLTSLLLANATINSTCYGTPTNKTTLEGLPEAVDGKFFFQSDELHHLTLVAYDENWDRRCAGGDYYEVDLHDRDNVHYRSRVPTKDYGNGSYGLELLVPSRFAGAFTLDIFLLYGNWHGMETDTARWVNKGLVLTQQLEMVVGEDLDNNSPKEPFIKQCTQADFDRTTWQGRWTRSWFNSNCTAENWTSRYRCLPEEHYWCEEPWCFGPVGRLEGNGWQYSAHCSFKIFEREEAWKCLDGKWFLTWGDSNFQDTIRNLLLFILDWNLPFPQKLSDFQLPRTYDMAFTNSHSYDQLFRVSQVFNGANNLRQNGEGLNTLVKNKDHQEFLLAHFNGTKFPDTVIMNSGLHDAHAFSTIEAYSEAADYVIEFWMKLYNGLPEDRRPRLIWRATITPAGTGRDMPANPMKMEMFNQVMAEKLQRVHDRLPVKFVDAFDLTFPFHYGHEFSDGGHYGRPPGSNLWPWHRKPHWYFVDIMLAHILLNTLCPTSA